MITDDRVSGYNGIVAVATGVRIYDSYSNGYDLGGSPQSSSVWTNKSYGSDISHKFTYMDLNWDFENTWDWIGETQSGYPILKPELFRTEYNP